MTKATVTMPLIAVIGIVSKKRIRINANALPTKPSFLASIGFGLPSHVRYLPIISIFQDAPMILPYARIVGPMKTKHAIANARGFCDSSILGINNRYAPIETANNPIRVPVRLKNNLKNLFFVAPIRFPTSWPLSDSHGEIRMGISTSTPIKKRFGR